MLAENYQFFCRSLGKALHMGTRLYEKEILRFTYSVYHLEIDPVGPFLQELLSEERTAGILITPLGQVYGFLTIQNDWRLILGPSRMTNDDPQLLEEQRFLLDVTEEKWEEYVRVFRCIPIFSAERMGWLLSMLMMALEHEKLSFEELYMNFHTLTFQQEFCRNQADAEEEDLADGPDFTIRDREYDFEKLILSYVRNGETEKLREIFAASPIGQGGHMADNTLRQIKDTCICAAAIASRAAVEGGVDHAAAFRLSDLYIQKAELLENIPSLEKLQGEIFIDFAEQVQKVMYQTNLPPQARKNSLLAACASYVSRNIYDNISMEELARTMGYTRSYFCDQFKKQTGLTLTQYVARQKILSAQRTLEYTDKSLGEIAQLYAFSSQSHFQNVYKRVTGETPLAYRKRVRKRPSNS